MDGETKERVYRYFLTYSGVKLPLKLVEPLQPADLGHRNTYFRATFDEADRMLTCEKIVYGEVELLHEYGYRLDGTMRHARIELGEDVTEIDFDENGAPVMR